MIKSDYRLKSNARISGHASRFHRLFTASLLSMALVFTGLVSFNNHSVTQAAPSGAIRDAGANSGDSPASGFSSSSRLSQNRQAGSNELWQELDRAALSFLIDPGIPAQSHMLRLNKAALAELLNRAPGEFKRDDGEPVVVLLPMPDGAFVRFQIEESTVLAPDLASQYPEISSYRGQGVDDPALTMRCDLSPSGFHALILFGSRTINLHPASSADDSVYVSYFGSDIQDSEAQCLVKDIHAINPVTARIAAPQVAVGPTLRTYRIAIAATWEYCNSYGGGTTAGTVASINTWLNGANAVYERELAIHLNLVNDTDVLYSTERGFAAGTDPYDNANVISMLDQVRPDLRDKVGQANYDMGHVFGQIAGTGGSGVAFLSVVCDDFNYQGLGPIKGGGATRVGGSAGNITALGVWVHELGHQFGANHNYNGTLGNCGGQRNSGTAHESGSGSTIMGYSGICGADNLTNAREMRFHAGSYAEITSYIAGANCATSSSTGNSAPTVDGGTDRTIPKNTPFTLTAIGNDADATDLPNLTYTWEQIDSGGTLYPQNGTSASYNDGADSATSTRPIFRPLPVSSSPSRTFPSLTYIRNNANDPPDLAGGFQTAEELPRIGRSLHFRVTIRDNRASGGGVNEDSVLLTVNGASGPFLVTVPNTAVTWPGGTMQTVTWSVNNTNGAPVNCANVKITLSTDGGLTFPTTLLASTANDGSEAVTVPSGISTTTARIKVEAVGNIFFDISDSNFTMTSSCPAITVTPATIANGTVNAGYNQAFGATGGVATYTFSLTAGPLPAGLTLSPAGVLSGTPTQAGMFNITIGTTDANLCVGTRAYTLTINCQTITLAPAGLPTGTVGVNYNQTITATGGTPPHTFSVTTGSLPAGLLLSAAGVLSGMPATQGTFNFTVTPTDGSNCAGSQDYAVNINGPTLVSLISFTASAFDNGTLVEWQTGFEADNLGFNLYRDDENHGNKSLINQQLIAGSAFLVGSATLGSGGSYQWWDNSPSSKSAAYWLEDRDLNGQSRWNGPFYPSQAGGKQRSASVQQAKTLAALSIPEAPPVRVESQAGLLASSGASWAARSQMQSVIISSPNRIKLSIKHEGWHRVTQQELAAAGLDSSLDPRNLQLFVDGKQQAVSVTGQEDGRLDPNDAVEFYGTGIDSTFSDLRTYYLVSGKRAGLRVASTKRPAHPSPQGSFDCTVERRDHTIYFSALRNGDKENFFGAVVAGEPVDQRLTLHHLAPPALPATLRVALQGVTNVSHHVTLRFNGSDVGELVFQGQAEVESSVSISPALLREGANQVTLIAQGGPSDVSLLGFVRVTYRHSFTADDDWLKLQARAGEQVTINGFRSEAIRVLDVTDPYAVQEVTGYLSQQESGSFSVSLAVPGKGQRSLLALTSERATRPAKVAPDYSSNLRDPLQGADLLIVTRDELIDSVRALKAFRQKQGLSVAVVDIEDIYDEFSFGQKTPHAVKDFIGFATTLWKKPIKYVLFFGDASLDPKNYLGFGDLDLVPTRLIDTTFMQTASDDWFADLNGNGIADIAVGRLPVRGAGEAQLIIKKIISYEQSSPAEEVLLVSDLNDGIDFERSNEQLIPLFSRESRITHIRRGQLGDQAARAALIDAINSGQRIVNYAGHGSVNVWRGDLLSSSDALQLQNRDHLSVFAIMNCLNGYFHDSAADSFGEALLKSSGGAVAVWASSAMTVAEGTAPMNQEFNRQLFASPRVRIGDAAISAKAATLDVDARRTWILLGDPTMMFK